MYLGIGVDRFWLFDVYCWDNDSQSACIWGEVCQYFLFLLFR